MFRAAKYEERLKRKADQGYRIWEELERVRRERERVERLGRWIREGGRCLAELEGVRGLYRDFAEQLNALRRDVAAHERADVQRQDANRLLYKAPALLKRLEAVEADRADRAAQESKLERELEEHRIRADGSQSAGEEIARLGPPLDRAEQKAAALRDLAPRLRDIRERCRKCRSGAVEWEAAGTRAEQAEMALRRADREFHRLMPDVCPLCGRSG